MRYLKTSTVATIDHLAKYLALRISIDGKWCDNSIPLGFGIPARPMLNIVVRRDSKPIPSILFGRENVFVKSSKCALWKLVYFWSKCTKFA